MLMGIMKNQIVVELQDHNKLEIAAVLDGLILWKVE
jgi:hypothetical protein